MDAETLDAVSGTRSQYESIWLCHCDAYKSSVILDLIESVLLIAAG